MEEYYFLFGLGIIWILFASLQDLKYKEVANWLTFSLIGIGLFYRLIYSYLFGEWNFVLYGVYGFLAFFVLAHLFYYGRVFAGGDAKLLIGMGALLPYSSLNGLLFWCLFFIFILFLMGGIWSLVWSLVLVKNSKNFWKVFMSVFRTSKFLMYLSLFLFVVLIFLVNILVLLWSALILVGIPLLYLYLQAVDHECMKVKVYPSKLSEGDWLVNDIKIGKKVIHASVHGLSIDDIKLLKKRGKKVLIKNGVPFIPSFLVAYLIMVFAYSIYGFDWEKLVFLLP